MNTKLLIASLIGVGSIGGAIAGGYYLSQESNKQPNTAAEPETKNEVAKANTEATQTPLTNVQPAPALPKEPAPTTPKRT